MKQFKYAYIITFLIGFAVSAFAQNEFKIIVIVAASMLPPLIMTPARSLFYRVLQQCRPG